MDTLATGPDVTLDGARVLRGDIKHQGRVCGRLQRIITNQVVLEDYLVLVSKPEEGAFRRHPMIFPRVGPQDQGRTRCQLKPVEDVENTVRAVCESFYSECHDLMTSGGQVQHILGTSQLFRVNEPQKFRRWARGQDTEIDRPLRSIESSFGLLRRDAELLVQRWGPQFRIHGLIELADPDDAIERLLKARNLIRPDEDAVPDLANFLENAEQDWTYQRGTYYRSGRFTDCSLPPQHLHSRPKISSRRRNHPAGTALLVNLPAFIGA